MMDLKERKPWRDEENRSDHKKCCTDCKTTQTPLWRGGPAGPKSLCNACGIRYRKRRIIGVGVDKDSDRQKQRTNITFTATATSASTSADSVCSSDSSSTSASGNNPMREPLNMSFVVWGKEVMIQRSSTIKKQRCQRRRKLREEEEAAFSLMALSCDSIFA